MEDHPHACGEYGLIPVIFDKTLGSPPRMWGIRFVVASERSSLRITPTYVGNTLRKARHINNPFLLYPQIYLLCI